MTPLMPGRLSHDRSERVGEVGAEDEVGEADLLLAPLDLLGGRRRVTRKYGDIGRQRLGLRSTYGQSRSDRR